MTALFRLPISKISTCVHPKRSILQVTCECRNFPQGTITDMVEDVLQGISFLFDNIVDYGGDPNR